MALESWEDLFREYPEPLEFNHIREPQHKASKHNVDKPLDLAEDLVWCSHQISLSELPC